MIPPRTKLLVLCTILAAGVAQAQSSSTTFSKATERFYGFDFAASVTGFRQAAQESTTRDQKLEAQYWLAKALWIRILDEQTDINNDFVTASIERVNISSKRVDETLRSEFLTVTKTNVELCQQALKAAPGDLNALYFLAAFRSNEAAYRLIVEQRQFAALSLVKSCMQMFRQVLARDPSRSQMLSLLGLTHYMVGSNPWYLRALAPLFGLEGTRAQGVDELARAAKGGSADAKFVLKSVLIHEGRFAEALPILEELAARYPANAAFLLQQGQVLSKLGCGAEAQTAFRDVLRRVQNGEVPDLRYTPATIRTLARAANVTL